MKLIGRELADDFSKCHADSKASLGAWIEVVEREIFKTPVHLKRMIGTADFVKPYTIFNISGNKYRLISMVNYKLSTILIKHILTHAKYDKGEWRA